MLEEQTATITCLEMGTGWVLFLPNPDRPPPPETLPMFLNSSSAYTLGSTVLDRSWKRCLRDYRRPPGRTLPGSEQSVLANGVQSGVCWAVAG